MRQFIYASGVTTKGKIDDMAVGNVAVAYINTNGETTITGTGAEVKKEGYFVVKKADGPLVIPFHTNNFSYEIAQPVAATKFKATITVPSPSVIGDYTIIVAKKGVGFNERNKWSADVHVSDPDKSSADKLAAELAKAIMNNAGSGVTATVSGAEITIEGTEFGVDYELIGADLLSGEDTTKLVAGDSGEMFAVEARGSKGRGTSKEIAELMSKAAADNGILYTYDDCMHTLYPTYGEDPRTSTALGEIGATVVTVRFAEPRAVKTRDEVVNQIIQIATASPSQAASLESIFKVFSGDTTATSAASVEDDEE